MYYAAVMLFAVGMALFNLVLAATCANAALAVLASNLWNKLNFVYAGLLVKLSDVPAWVYWLTYPTPLGFALAALAVNEVGARMPIKDDLDGMFVEINAAFIMGPLSGYELGRYAADALTLCGFLLAYAALLLVLVVYRMREHRKTVALRNAYLDQKPSASVCSTTQHRHRFSGDSPASGAGARGRPVCRPVRGG